VLYLLGSVALKIRVLRVRWDRRFVAAVLAVVATVLGQRLPALALWTVLLGILAGLAVVEGLEARTRPEALSDDEERATETPLATPR
jgi:hypothetical protein